VEPSWIVAVPHEDTRPWSSESSGRSKWTITKSPSPFEAVVERSLLALLILNACKVVSTDERLDGLRRPASPARSSKDLELCPPQES
jgi:hypothetical protein